MYRYKPNKSWRDDGKSASPTTMRAREWKSNKQQQKQHKSYGYSGQQRLASTPEAQLLQFQSCRSSRFNSKKIRISRHDPNMTLRPAEGKGQFPMTLGDGSRVFVKMDPIQERTSRSSRLNNDDNSNVYSLGISMTDLIRRLQAVQRKKEHDKLKALQTEARKTKRSLEKAMADDTVEEDSNAEGSENLVETELLDNGNENMQLEADKITEEESTNKSQIEDPSKFAAIDDDYNELTIIVSNIESQLGVENVLAWDEDAFYDWVRREWSARNEEHPFPDRHLERLKKQRQNKSKGQDESDRTGEKPKTSARKGEHPYRRDRHVENFKAQGKAKLKQNKDNDQSEEESTSTRPIDDRLWVDKHAPSSFANLLSDERTNREVLRALREWDPYVFNRDPPPRPKFARSNNDEEDDNDNKKDPKDKRPDEKRRVILLSGPPGVGKSTLAHIVTKHCGYRPMEVNGSDERSASVLTERVIRAMESTTLDMHASNTRKDWRGRPNCLILDEIDGADASKALKALVELIRQEARSSKEGSRRSKPYLKRPIIFICNNLYAPALRPLLPFARRFQVGAPSPARLVARLRAVLSAEGLSLWGGATLLNELVTATGGDIRSCLYTLQFAAAEVNQKKDGDISKALMSALNGNGMKDDRSDVAGTTMTVYRKCKKKGRDSALWGTKQLEDPRTSVERVLDAVEVSILVGTYIFCISRSFAVPEGSRFDSHDRRSASIYFFCRASGTMPSFWIVYIST